tara:strand:- start:87 stop:278 length:192 start_codon:yes stop_codon:yes gene_type:complete
MPVNNPAKLTVASVESSAATIHTTVQTWMRANIAAGDTFYELNFLPPNKVNGKVICQIMFEDQ